MRCFDWSLADIPVVYFYIFHWYFSLNTIDNPVELSIAINYSEPDQICFVVLVVVVILAFCFVKSRTFRLVREKFRLQLEAK